MSDNQLVQHVVAAIFEELERQDWEGMIDQNECGFAWFYPANGELAGIPDWNNLAGAMIDAYRELQ